MWHAFLIGFGAVLGIFTAICVLAFIGGFYQAFVKSFRAAYYRKQSEKIVERNKVVNLHERGH